MDTSRHHVALVRPHRAVSPGTWSVPITPPIGLAYLAAVLREAGHEVSAVDALAEGVGVSFEDDGYYCVGLKPDDTAALINPAATVIAVTCMFSQEWPSSRALIAAIRTRFPKAVIIAGGEHVTALPEFCLRECPALDAVGLGEGEDTLREFTEHAADRSSWSSITGLGFLDEGRYVETPARQRIRGVDDIPWPVWDIFPMEAYLGNTNTFGVYRGRSMPILASRGCPYSCTFCSNPSMYGVLWKARKPSDVVDEIQAYRDRYQADNIDFYDLTMVLNKKWIIEFADELKRRQVKITWQLPSGTRTEIIDDEVAHALESSGCRNVVFAPESGSQRVLKSIKKAIKKDKLGAAIRASVRNGISVKTNHILGFPHEQRIDVIKTVWFGWQQAWWGVDTTSFTLFSPYPGSALFDEMRADGTIKELDREYFRSLAVYMDPWESTQYCKHIGGRELAFWRLFGMVSFFGISTLMRPWRAVRAVWNVYHNRSETYLEHRLREWFGVSTLPTRGETVSRSS